MRREIVKRLVISLALLSLVPVVAQATTYHVTSNDKNGDGVVDQAGSCVNHATVGSNWVSCADSATNNCTLAKPCCTMQTALDKATSPGDIVEVHAGTYDATIDGITRVSMGGGATNFDILAIVQPCAACTVEADRRIVRGAIITTQDKPLLIGDANTEGAIILGGEGTTLHTDFVTVQSFDIRDFNYNESGRAHVMGAGDGSHHYAIWDNITMGTMNGGTDLGESYVLFIWQTSFTGGEGGDYQILKNSTFVATNHMYRGAGSASTGCATTGSIVKNNVFDVAFIAGGEMANDQGVCGAWYNNYWDQSSTRGTHWLHHRAVLGPHYVFNNYYRLVGRGAFHQTNDSGSNIKSTQYFFNNTYTNTSDSSYTMGNSNSENALSNAVRGLEDISTFVNLLVQNRSIMGPSLTTGRKLGGRHGYSAFESANYCYGAGGAECPDGWVTDLGNFQANTSDFGLKGTGAFPVPQMQLDTGSAMIGAGFNDPLAQGADICIITPWAAADATITTTRSKGWGCGDDNANGTCDVGEVCKDAEACQDIDCSVDYDGDNRGAVWDIGADEFVGTATSSLPAPSGVKRGEVTAQ